MAKPHNPARARYVLVILLACASLIAWLPDLKRDFGHPLGNAGVGVDYSGRVIAVSPQAAAAGVKIGDRVDLRGKTPAERFGAFLTITADAGTPITIPLTSHGHSYSARIITKPEIPNVPVIVLRQLGALLVLILGAFLVLKRPNKATWAWFFFTLGSGAPINEFVLIGPIWWLTIANLWSFILEVAPSFFGAIFALHLLHEGPLPAWRSRLEAGIYALMLGTVASQAIAVLLFLYFGINWWQGEIIVGAVSTLTYASIPAILIATYAESGTLTRGRLRWVIWAFSIGALANVADWLGSPWNLGGYVTTYLQHSVLVLATTAVPAVAVLYAILKHRIIDINVAISRAVVYATLSAVIVGIFALVDLFFTNALSSGRIGLIADMGLALILGFSFNALHARVDRFMDWLFFRSRHRAEQHVATIASAIPYARTEEHVNRLLIDEPVRAFGLVDGMLMRVQSGGQLQFVHSVRRHGAQPPIEDAESLVAILKAQRKPWRLDGQHMAVAVPIFSDMELEAVAFYAPHLNGTDLDGDELALIESAALASGASYARFRAAALRERVAALEDENAQLRAAVTVS